MGAWDFTITQGTHRTIRLTLKDENGTLLNPERVWATVKRHRRDAEAKALLTKDSHSNGTPTPDEIEIVDVDAGRVDLKFVPADTEGIAAGDYWWDCKTMTTAGQLVDPIREAKFTVDSAVTTRAS